MASVTVVHPKRAAPAQEIVLPGNMQAFIDAPIYARTNGYLKKWYVDIGARVKKGQLLAEIETPEVDQQLAAGARRPGHGAKPTCTSRGSPPTRYQDLLKTRLRLASRMPTTPPATTRPSRPSSSPQSQREAPGGSAIVREDLRAV